MIVRVLRGLTLTLSAGVFLCACSGGESPAERPNEAAAPGFVNRVWRVSESSGVAAGTLYVFLSEGTLLVTSPHGTPALGSWRIDAGALTMVEESIPYKVDILELRADEFHIRSNNPGGAVEMTLVPADAAVSFPDVHTAQGAIVVVRHAERADATADSALSSAGQARAMRLAVMLKDAGITHIFTTDLRRTVQTAEPVAAALKVTPTEVPAGDLDALLNRLRALSSRDRVLVVGHSNTIPEIVRRLGVSTPITIGDQEYDNLFIVMPLGEVTASSVRLRY
jgi:phosphohistidine phosphatase SixA